jgi:hypothetical protein
MTPPLYQIGGICANDASQSMTRRAPAFFAQQLRTPHLFEHLTKRLYCSRTCQVLGRCCGARSRPGKRPVPICRRSNVAVSDLWNGKKWWWAGVESNRRHKDFQSFALPTELPAHRCGQRRTFIATDPRRRMQPLIAATSRPATRRNQSPSLRDSPHRGDRSPAPRSGWSR